MTNTNTGDWNTGSRNTGDSNTGHWNTGSRNTGDSNTGNRNTGDWNTGSRNTGDSNTGNRNTGHWNTGHWNSASHCTGAFNNKPQKMILFNKELDMTVEEFYRDYDIHANIKLTECVLKRDMTDGEKKANPEYKTIGGYLKKRDYKDACREWWKEADQEERDRFLNLPGFDWEVFTDITGILPDETNPEREEEPEIIELNGKKYKLITN